MFAHLTGYCVFNRIPIIPIIAALASLDGLPGKEGKINDVCPLSNVNGTNIKIETTISAATKTLAC